MSKEKQTGIDAGTVTDITQTLTIETTISNNEVIILSATKVEGVKMFTIQLLDIDNDSARIKVSSLDIIVDAIRDYQRKFEKLNSDINSK